MDVKIVLILLYIDFGLCSVVYLKKQPKIIILDDVKIEPKTRRIRQANYDNMEYDYAAQMWRPTTTQPTNDLEYDYEAQMWRPKSTEPTPIQMEPERTGEITELNSANNYGLDANETASGSNPTTTTPETSETIPIANQNVPIARPVTNPNQNRPQIGRNPASPMQTGSNNDWQIAFPNGDAQTGYYNSGTQPGNNNNGAQTGYINSGAQPSRGAQTRPQYIPYGYNNYYTNRRRQ